MKTKALISFAVTAKLICIFVFAYAKRWFSHDAAHIFECQITPIFVYSSESSIATMMSTLDHNDDYHQIMLSSNYDDDDNVNDV